MLHLEGAALEPHTHGFDLEGWLGSRTYSLVSEALPLSARAKGTRT